ncbi:MAG TPA: DJ-1/PfpI family protein [Kofleriaceae bacterium]|nr:DJ-1/PfpI family protein [Kofleriaceae bacterium]
MSRVVILTFDGAQGLDVVGPAEVFGGVARITGARGYDVVVAASRAGAVATSSGLALGVRGLAGLAVRRSDTVLVAGGEEGGVRAAVGDRALVRFVARAARRARRIGSVCSGAFVLAAAGVLDGKRAATHWSACRQLAAYRPAVRVDPESIYVRDGTVWTSAGVTTGIDMALAMVEDDLGRAVADAVAARLVLHARRPGFQSQWSDALVAQQDRGAPLGRAIGWLREHVREPIDVERLARHCAMSVRTFHRRCLEHLRITPRRLIENVRIEEARALLATTELPVKTIAARCGFGDATRMSHAFHRALGLAPGAYRLVAG